MSQMKAVVNQLLTGVSSMQAPSNYICEQILTPLQHAQYTGSLAKYGRSHLRIVNSITGGRGRFRRVEPITTSTTAFEIESHGLEGFVSKRDYANKNDPFDAEKDETMGVTTMLHIEKEKMLADTLGNTSILSQNQTLSGTSQFSDYNNSDPLAIFKAARTAMRQGCGQYADTAIMDLAVADMLKYHPQLLDFLGFKEARPGGLTYEELMKVLEVKRLLIADAQYNASADGQADDMQNVWGKNIVFGVCPLKPEVYQTSLGYMIRLEGEQPRKVYTQANFNPPGSTSILVEDEYDMLVSNAGAGYLIKDAIA